MLTLDFVPWRVIRGWYPVSLGEWHIFTASAVDNISSFWSLDPQHDPKSLVDFFHTSEAFLQVLYGSAERSRLLTGTHRFSPERRQFPDLTGSNHIM
jgi:hypothetical protein